MDLLDIVFLIVTLCVVIGCFIVVLNAFSPLKQCENNPDNYSIRFNNKIYTCGELKAINTTIAGEVANECLSS